MLTSHDVLARLLVATLAGAVLGFDREIQQKPAGLRTLALVSLGSALFTTFSLTYQGPVPADPFRVVQGVITGIGFLGAGVILHRGDSAAVSGVTTAASIWIAAAMGIGCGLGRWFETLTGLGLAMVVLVVVRGLESQLRTRGKR